MGPIDDINTTRMIVFVRGAIDSKYYVYVDISLSCKTFRVRRWHSCAFENDPLGLSVVCVKHAQFLSGGEAHVPSFARETHLNSDQILVICCYMGTTTAQFYQHTILGGSSPSQLASA